MSDKFRMIPDYRVISRVSILAETKDYNHEMMNIPHMWRTTKGDGIKLVVLDTGLPKHFDLMPGGGYSCIPGYKEDKNGHSTHVAGIIAAIAHNDMGVAGIAPDVDDYYGAVLDEDGSGSLEAVAQGIYKAVDDIGANIINMSLGIPGGMGTVTQLEEACNYAASQGVTIIAAAGNEAGAVGQPAIYDSVIAVGAVDSQKEHAEFSNTAGVDFAAGGVNVYSTYLRNTYAKLSGTSMACPALAAVAALIMSEHKQQYDYVLSPAEIRDRLQKISFDVGPDGFDDMHGHGIPIFGHNPDNPPVDEKPTPPPFQGTKPKKDGPSADCAYWKLWHNFTQAVNMGLAEPNARMEDGLKAGFRALATDTLAISRLITQDK